MPDAENDAMSQPDRDEPMAVADDREHDSDPDENDDDEKPDDNS